MIVFRICNLSFYHTYKGEYVEQCNLHKDSAILVDLWRYCDEKGILDNLTFKANMLCDFCVSVAFITNLVIFPSLTYTSLELANYAFSGASIAY